MVQKTGASDDEGRLGLLLVRLLLYFDMCADFFEAVILRLLLL